MSARLLDGQKLAAVLQTEIRPRVEAYTARVGQPPGLAIVLVGDDPASEVYVRNKVRTGQEVGFRVDLERLPATASLDDVLGVVSRLNADDRYDGILVQSPLPAALGKHAEQRVFDAISVDKDVDGVFANLLRQRFIGQAPRFAPVMACRLHPPGVAIGAQGVRIAERLDHGGIVVLHRRLQEVGRGMLDEVG